MVLRSTNLDHAAKGHNGVEYPDLTLDSSLYTVLDTLISIKLLHPPTALLVKSPPIAGHQTGESVLFQHESNYSGCPRTVLQLHPLLIYQFDLEDLKGEVSPLRSR